MEKQTYVCIRCIFMDSYNRGSHSVYKLTYHIIFVTKYRKKVITDEIGDQLSKEVRATYASHVERYLWKDAFWSASYFCATTGSVSMETVRSYIESQRTSEHKRKYTKSGKYKRAIHPSTD